MRLYNDQRDPLPVSRSVQTQLFLLESQRIASLITDYAMMDRFL